MVLLTNSTMYSQTAVLNEKGDTTICFTLPQSKFLLKTQYKLKECDTLNKICELQLSLSDSIIRSDKVIQNNQSLMLRNKDEQIGLYKHEISSLRLQLSDSQRATRRQKVYKWLAIGGGATLSGFLGYKYITHP
jgi:hypothetical protein